MQALTHVRATAVQATATRFFNLPVPDKIARRKNSEPQQHNEMLNSLDSRDNKFSLRIKYRSGFSDHSDPDNSLAAFRTVEGVGFRPAAKNPTQATDLLTHDALQACFTTMGTFQVFHFSRSNTIAD